MATAMRSALGALPRPGLATNVVIHYVHDLLTEEFVNVGVVLVSNDGFADARFHASWKRVTAMFPEADATNLRRLGLGVRDAVREHGRRWCRELPLEPRLDARMLVSALVSPQGTGLRASSPVSGVTSDPKRTLDELYERYVEKFGTKPDKSTREDNDVWRAFTERFAERESYLEALRPHSVTGRHFDYEFSHAWQNGCWNAAQPLSFDLREPHRILDKAVGWVGRIKALEISPKEFKVVFLVGLPPVDSSKGLRRAASDATSILSEHLEGAARVVSEAESAELVLEIVEDIDRRASGSAG